MVLKIRINDESIMLNKKKKNVINHFYLYRFMLKFQLAFNYVFFGLSSQ